MIESAAHVLILTGTPGAGKTTTARALVSALDRPGVHLHADVFWHFIRSGAIPPYLPAARRQNEVVMDVLAHAAEGYAKGGYFVAVDGIVGPWFLEPFRRLSVSIDYIVLRPSLEEAIARCRQRGGDELSDPKPITALHKQLSSLSELEKHVIETAGLDAAETLAKVRSALESGSYRLS